jgi:hypothetical protein
MASIAFGVFGADGTRLVVVDDVAPAKGPRSSA